MRNIAILRDGYSDFLVIRQLVKSILRKHRAEDIQDTSFTDMENLNITLPLIKYIDKASKTSNFSIHSRDAEELIKTLLSIYYGCYSKMLKEYDEVTSKVILVINADAEHILVERENYFKEWSYNLKTLLGYSIEKFYEEMVKQGNSYDYLPCIVPLLLFPSSEIIVASCMYDVSSESLRSYKPTPALKHKVYGTSSIADAIADGTLTLTLDTYVTEDRINEIYREIPEARMLIHTLAN